MTHSDNKADLMGDRNFDDLVEQFSSKVANSYKGELRRAVIWNDLSQWVDFKGEKTLKVIDIGAGLGHFSLKLAKMGHDVCYNDISEQMMLAAKRAASQYQLENKIKWLNKPYQELSQILRDQAFDLVLCHAVLEWIAEPGQLIDLLSHIMHAESLLSLCSYNQAGRIYRNLIRGNFNAVRNAPDKPSSGRGLTPINPQSIEDIERLLTMNGLSIVQRSGIRVFSDYVQVKIGGNAIEEEVTRMELDMSQKEPYWRMGRYVHFCARLGE